MCRWLAYSGNEIYLSRLLFEPVVSREADCWADLALDASGFARHARIIVSEPFGGVGEAWDEVPEGSVVVVEGSSIERQPFEPRRS